MLGARFELIHPCRSQTWNVKRMSKPASHTGPAATARSGRSASEGISGMFWRSRLGDPGLRGDAKGGRKGLGVLHKAVLDHTPPPDVEKLHTFVCIRLAGRKRRRHCEACSDPCIPGKALDDDALRLELQAGKDTKQALEPTADGRSSLECAPQGMMAGEA